MCTVEEKQKIQKVIDIFQDYLQQTKNEYGRPKYDIVWLDNLRSYLLVLNYHESDDFTEQKLLTVPIRSAEELYVELIDDIIQAYCIHSGLLELAIEEITEQSRKQVEIDIMAYLAPYMAALPEYRELTEKIVKEQCRLFTGELSLEEFLESYQ